MDVIFRPFRSSPWPICCCLSTKCPHQLHLSILYLHSIDLTNSSRDDKDLINFSFYHDSFFVCSFWLRMCLINEPESNRMKTKDEKKKIQKCITMECVHNTATWRCDIFPRSHLSFWMIFEVCCAIAFLSFDCMRCDKTIELHATV